MVDEEFDKRANDDKGENSLDGVDFDRTIITENAGFNLVGFKAARMVSGNVDIFQVGVIGGVGFPPTPVWPTPNTFGQRPGWNVVVDANGNIMDNTTATPTILIPALNGVDISDGLYQAGEVNSNGNVVATDSIIRLENISSSKDGVVIDTSVRQEKTDITTRVQGAN